MKLRMTRRRLRSMIDFDIQWEALAQEVNKSGIRRVYPDHILDFFVGYSEDGERQLAIMHRGATVPPLDLPTFENLDVIAESHKGEFKILLVIKNKELEDKFTVMCFDIAESSKESLSSIEALKKVAKSLSRWADLFKTSNPARLKMNQAIGLWGEIKILKDLIEENIEGVDVVVRGWRGPNGDQKDIGYNRRRIEIKTQLSTRKTQLAISSLDQLDDNVEMLMIVLNRVSPADDGYSILDLVKITQNLIRESKEATLDFKRKIILAGYDDTDDQCKAKYALNEMLIYKVNDTFPRLIPRNVPVGITSAQYAILCSAITSFEIKWSALVEGMK